MPNISEFTSTLRHEHDLSKISGTIQSVRDSRFDLVADQASLSMTANPTGRRPRVQITNPTGEPMITGSGVFPAVIESAFTRTAERQIATRLNLPIKYYDRLSQSDGLRLRALALHSVNELAAADPRKALYRFLQADDGLVLRSVLSDSYGLFDNDLAIKALMEGLTASGHDLGDCSVEGDVTPDRLRLRIHVPGIELAVPELLGDYKMPFSMKEGNNMHARPDDGETPPVLWAGIEIGNSETGNGTFYVAPRAVVAVCRNGLTKPVEFKRAHLGARLDEGHVQWSDTTRQNVYELVTSQVADVVSTYLSADYLKALADEMGDAKKQEIESPGTAIEVVTDRLALSDVEARNVFDCFARGGDHTVLGVANAVTAAAQLVPETDRQAELECEFWTIVNQPQAFANA